MSSLGAVNLKYCERLIAITLSPMVVIQEHYKRDWMHSGTGENENRGVIELKQNNDKSSLIIYNT